MYHTNNVVIMQMEQLGCIETLEEKVHILEGHTQDLENKLAEQDHVIANLVGDNLDHLQDNMQLTACHYFYHLVMISDSTHLF